MSNCVNLFAELLIFGYVGWCMQLIEAPLSKTPLDTAVISHWLAIEGVQPAIPENAPIEGVSQNLNALR